MDEFLKGFLSENERTGDPTSKWVEWEHISQGRTHCEDCLVLDGCWFQKSNKPNIPRHPYCHCVTKPVDYTRVLNQAFTISPHGKYIPYLFDTTGKYGHGKDVMFTSWGYPVEDADLLKELIAEQALYKYVSGDYKLGKLDHDGQRLSIRIELERRKGEGTVSFIIGWMVKPNGLIKLNTPYGGE